MASANGYKYTETPVAPIGVAAEPADNQNVDMDALSEDCNPGDDFGYRNGTPCVLLKINRVGYIYTIIILFIYLLFYIFIYYFILFYFYNFLLV